jgi:hypothetical protein
MQLRLSDDLQLEGTRGYWRHVSNLRSKVLAMGLAPTALASAVIVSLAVSDTHVSATLKDDSVVSIARSDVEDGNYWGVTTSGAAVQRSQLTSDFVPIYFRSSLIDPGGVDATEVYDFVHLGCVTPLNDTTVSEVTAIASKIAAWEADFLSQWEQIPALVEALDASATEGQFASFSAQIETLNSAVESLENNIGDVEVDDVQASIDALNVTDASLAASIASAQSTISTLQASLAAANAVISTLTTGVASNDTELTLVSTALNAIEVRLTALEAV